MNRFGKAIVAALLLLLVGFVSMVRFGSVEPARPKAPAPVVVERRPVIPVQGVAREALVDTFRDPRTGHVHGAIDIPAPLGTAVLAAEAGRVERIFESRAGGHTVYVRSPDRRWIYYFAHLDRYAAGLVEGQSIARGAAIGTVGYSGNADPAGPHLHFEIKAMAPGEPWYRGRAVDPYPILTGR